MGFKKRFARKGPTESTSTSTSPVSGDFSTSGSTTSSMGRLRMRRKRSKNTGGPSSVTPSCYSLGAGTFSADGLVVSFVPSPRGPRDASSSVTCDESSREREREREHELSPIEETARPTIFIRAADLPSLDHSIDWTTSTHSFRRLPESERIDYVHRYSNQSPLESVAHDPAERWVALDDGLGRRAPLAEAVTNALVKACLDAAMDQTMWTAANSATSKAIKGHWKGVPFRPLEGPGGSVEAPLPEGATRGTKVEKEVLLWSGSFAHNYYGADLPVIRSESVVNMSASKLADLLVDSSRVKEYNKMSMGRDDLMVLPQTKAERNNAGELEQVTKVICSRSKPPMLGKILQLKSLLHMERLNRRGEGGQESSEAGYVIVTRSVAHREGDGEGGTSSDPKVVSSEMLMGVNVLRPVEGEPDRCIMINVNQLYSPIIPAMMGRRIGLGAAGNFVNDIRALC